MAKAIKNITTAIATIAANIVRQPEVVLFFFIYNLL